MSGITYINRADMVKVVNQWRIAHRRHGYPIKLYSGKHWQQAIFVARQNKIFTPESLRALAKHGYVAVRETK